jgi:hypothetical protein
MLLFRSNKLEDWQLRFGAHDGAVFIAVTRTKGGGWQRESFS